MPILAAVCSHWPSFGSILAAWPTTRADKTPPANEFRNLAQGRPRHPGGTIGRGGIVALRGLPRHIYTFTIGPPNGAPFQAHIYTSLCKYATLRK